MGKATSDLRDEHDSILFVLKIVDKMLLPGTKKDAGKLRYFRELVYFLKIFADRCHHGKEEGFLFTELVNRGVRNEGGPIGVMLQEHVQGREYIAQMSEALDDEDVGGFSAAALKYSGLLRSHIGKENNVLFEMADRLLNDEAQNLMFEKFEHHEEKVIGHGVHEKLHSMIHSWATDFKVQDE